MDIKVGKQQLPTKYTYEELTEMMNKNTTEKVEVKEEQPKKDEYIKIQEPEKVKYKDEDGKVVLKGKEIIKSPELEEREIDIELSNILKTEEILKNEETEDLKKAM